MKNQVIVVIGVFFAFAMAQMAVAEGVIFTPSGSGQIEIDTKGAIIWLVQGNVSNATEANCTFEDEQTEEEIDVAYEAHFSPAGDSPAKIEIYWMTNASEGFQEGHQVGIYCDVKVDDVWYKNIEQIVYINRQKTIMAYLDYFYDSVMEILGYQRYEMDIVTPNFWDGAESKFLVEFKDRRGPYADATCSVEIEEEQTNVTHELNMSYYGAGLYVVNWEPSLGVTQALSKVSCEVPSLNSTFQDSLMLSQHERKLSIAVAGTDYYVGERGTIFVQLTDDQRLAENKNVQCGVTIYYPYGYNVTHPVWVQDAPMTYKNGSGGLYYYDFIVPDYEGVYMVSALCSYEDANTFVYSLDGTETEKPWRNTTYGVYSGDTVFLNDYEDWIYERCGGQTVGGQKICDSYYDFNVSTHFDLTYYNITGFELNYMGESTQPNIIQFSIWNWTSSSWRALGNLTFGATASGTLPAGIGDYFLGTFAAPGLMSNDGIVRVRLYADSGQTWYLFNNWLNLEVFPKRGNIVEVKGQSELNVKRGVPITSSLLLEAELISQRYFAGTPGQVLLQLTRSGRSVTNATCALTIYNGTLGKVVDAQNMTFSGDDGIYYYNWTPPAAVANNYPARALCNESSMSAQSAASMTVEYGVVMQSVT